MTMKLGIAILMLALNANSAMAKSKVLGEKPQLNLEEAKKLVAASEAYAKSKNVPCTIAVADDTGYLVLVEKMDNVMLSSTLLAPEKAKSAVLFKRASADLEKTINEGRTAMVTVPAGLVMMQGGLTLTYESKVVGAIAASCDVKDQDVPVATAGSDAFKP